MVHVSLSCTAGRQWYGVVRPASAGRVPPEGGGTGWYDRLQPVASRRKAVVHVSLSCTAGRRWYMSACPAPPEGGGTGWYDRHQSVSHRLKAMVRDGTTGFSRSRPAGRRRYGRPPEGGGTGWYDRLEPVTRPPEGGGTGAPGVGAGRRRSPSGSDVHRWRPDRTAW